jgi:methionine-R-sulfoxide reductase
MKKLPTKEELKIKLTPLQYSVTQEADTEKPFANTYWDNKKEGIYVDIISGVPLYSSRDKYDSGTGWPSFTRPISEKNISLHEDN